ncbi:MAG TPA: hypothetical protein PKE55_08505 [Kiritimatiellia bacterium]|nr:hypothetical protein [Kiritimatiellia bacterium]
MTRMLSGTRARTLILAFLIHPLLAPSASARPEIFPYLSLMAMEWTEYIDGRTLLTEEGPWFGIGLDVRTNLDPLFRWDVRSEFHFGRVSYDGFLVDRNFNVEPYRSHTIYSGVKLETDIAYLALDRDLVQLRPLGGFGLRYWLRMLDEGRENGYDEYWFTFFMRLGMELSVAANETTTWYLRGIALIPIYNREQVEGLNFLGTDSATLSPGKRPGFIIESGRRGPIFDLSLFVEYLQFSKSDLDRSGQFFQPESELRLLGFRAAVRF